MQARQRVTRPRTRRSASRSGAERSDLEVHLTAEFWRYALDVPEEAFPSFLESLYFEPLSENPVDPVSPILKTTTHKAN